MIRKLANLKTLKLAPIAFANYKAVLAKVKKKKNIVSKKIAYLAQNKIAPL